ncbi:VOC family protein [Actinoallomurus acanthiterrae]
MSSSPLVIGLPIADRQRSYTFYREGLGLEPVGEPADDGVPEPLQFVINDGVRVMFIPTGGFGWVIGDRAVAESGTSECVLTLPVVTPADADQMITRARTAGATVITAPGQQPWGYAGVFADPDGHVWMVSVQP